MTLSQMRASARVYLQDASGTRWPDAELDAWFNEALVDFCIKTGATATDATLSVNAKTPANAFYDLPSDLVSLTSVSAGGLELCPVALSDLACIENWETDTGEPYRYVYGPWGQSLLRVYPYQASTVKVFYIQAPETLVFEADTPSILSIYHQRLVYFAVARAYLKDFEYKDPAKGQAFQAQYEEGVALTIGNAPSAPMGVPFRYL